MEARALPTPRTDTLILLAIFLSSFLIHFLCSGMLGYHRDEFLYLALGNHPGWGHWSNPPFIGWISFCSQNLFGESIAAIHVARIWYQGLPL